MVVKGFGMFEMVSEIFSSSSDKARGVTILFSSLVAIGIFVSNQRHINRRNQKALLVEKIEELHLAAADYAGAVDELVSFCKGRVVKNAELEALDASVPERSWTAGGVPQELLAKVTSTLGRMEMLCGLYFPEEQFAFHEFGIKALPYVEKCISGVSPIVISHSGTLNRTENHSKIAKASVNDLCVRLMGKQSETAFGKLKRWYRKCKLT